MNVGISYGAMGDPLAEQLKAQGVVAIADDELRRHEKIRHAINMLTLHGIITGSQTQKAFQKLHKRVLRNVEEIK